MQIKVKYLNDSVERIKKFENGDWVDLRCYDAEIINTINKVVEGYTQLPILSRKTYSTSVQWKLGIYEGKQVEFFRYKAGDFLYINLGLSMELPKGCEANIVPRSSSYKTYGTIQVNSFGVVDESYKGNNDIWFVPLLAIQDGFIIKNERVCQFRANSKMKDFEVIEVDSLGNEDRKGFGSTGNN